MPRAVSRFPQCKSSQLLIKYDTQKIWVWYCQHVFVEKISRKLAVSPQRTDHHVYLLIVRDRIRLFLGKYASTFLEHQMLIIVFGVSIPLEIGSSTIYDSAGTIKGLKDIPISRARATSSCVTMQLCWHGRSRSPRTMARVDCGVASWSWCDRSRIAP